MHPFLWSELFFFVNFYILDNRVYCEACYSSKEISQMLPFCAICFKEITDNICTAMGRRFHTNCFRCIICKRPLSGAEFRLGPGPEWEVRPFSPINQDFNFIIATLSTRLGWKVRAEMWRMSSANPPSCQLGPYRMLSSKPTSIECFSSFSLFQQEITSSKLHLPSTSIIYLRKCLLLIKLPIAKASNERFVYYLCRSTFMVIV